MQKIVHDDEKYVEIWLTNAESQDTDLRESLKPLCKEYKQKKYRVVIFSSGKGDLLTLPRYALANPLSVLANLLCRS